MNAHLIAVEPRASELFIVKNLPRLHLFNVLKIIIKKFCKIFLYNWMNYVNYGSGLLEVDHRYDFFIFSLKVNEGTCVWTSTKSSTAADMTTRVRA